MFDSNKIFLFRNFLDQEEIVSICQIHDEYIKCVSDFILSRKSLILLTEHDRTANIAHRFLLTKSSSDKCSEEKTYVDSSERFHSDQFKRYLHDLLGFYIRLEVLKAFDHVDVIED